MTIVAIGLEDVDVEEINLITGKKLMCFPSPPRIYAKGGRAFVAHPWVMGYYFEPEFVLWYGYFEDPSDPMRNTIIRGSRLALAISNTPTYPDVRTTLPWDDKMLSVVMALNVEGDSPARGLFPPMNPVQATPKTVLKWGNSHCGEGKQLLVTGEEESEATLGDVLAEPFVEGRSYRILIVDNYLCQLEYESADWRKNVRGSVKLCSEVDPDMAARSQEIVDRYFLSVAGIDFVKPDDGPAQLLEVNCYPALDQDPLKSPTANKFQRSAREVFCREAAYRILHNPGV